ncbi:MAG: hypothetical protein AAF639_43850 [Chloroflexota bacterium]
MIDLTDAQNVEKYAQACGHFQNDPEKLRNFHNYVQVNCAKYPQPNSEDDIDRIYEDIYEDYLTDGS